MAALAGEEVTEGEVEECRIVARLRRRLGAEELVRVDFERVEVGRVLRVLHPRDVLRFHAA